MLEKKESVQAGRGKAWRMWDQETSGLVVGCEAAAQDDSEPGMLCALLLHEKATDLSEKFPYLSD